MQCVIFESIFTCSIANTLLDFIQLGEVLL